MKLLVIEDNPIWQTKIEMILIELGFTHVEICDTLQGAHTFLTNAHVDLIIADIILGDEIVFDLAKDPAYKDIPFLFITSHEDSELYELSKAIPDSFFLIKPFHKLTVLAAIENVMLHYNKLHPKKHAGVTVKGPYGEKIFLTIDQIVFIKSELNYCIIKTPKNQFILKISLKQIKETFGDDVIQIHKTYMVNKKQIKNIFLTKMQLETTAGPLPIGRLFKPQIITYMNDHIEI